MTNLPRWALLATFGVLAPTAGAGCRAGLAPLVGIDELEPAELRARLNDLRPPLVVDVRDARAFGAGHIAGAVSLRMEDLEGYFTRLGPSRDRPLVFACHGGVRSVLAAATVAPLGYLEVYSLAGGMEAWRAGGHPTVAGPPQHLPPSVVRPPVLPLTGFQQLVLICAAFVIKPGYVLLALLLILLLRRARTRDLVLIRRSLVAFFVGEVACYLNTFLAHGQSDAWELLHGAGMVGQNILLPWGLFVFLDRRVLHFTADDGVCAVQRLCGRCWKRDGVSCGLQRLFLFLVPALGALACLPLTAPLRPLRIVLPVFGFDWVSSVSLFEAFVEFRVYVLLALSCLAATLALLLSGRAGLRRAQLPFFAGLGFLLFPLFRFFLFEAYRDMPVWSDFWEEATEFVVTAGIGVFLVVFRRTLGLFGNRAPAETE